MSSSKKTDLSRDFVAGVYRQAIQSVKLVFSSQLCELLPVSSSLWFISSLYTVCKGGGGGGLWDSWPQTDKQNLPQSPFKGQFFLMTTFGGAFCESYYSTLLRWSQIVVSASMKMAGLIYRRWKRVRFKSVRFSFNIGRVTNPHWKSLGRSELIKSARIIRWYWRVSIAHERNRQGFNKKG